MPEQTARARSEDYVLPNEGEALWFTTDLYVAKLTGDDTNGAVTVFEVTAAPGAPPLPHMHRHEDETYYVLDGEFEFMDDGSTFRVGPGSVVHLRRDRFHFHRNAGAEPAHALVVYTPGGSIERFVAEAGKPAADRLSLPPTFDEADVSRLISAAQRYGFETPPDAG